MVVQAAQTGVGAHKAHLEKAKTVNRRHQLFSCCRLVEKVDEGQATSACKEEERKGENFSFEETKLQAKKELANGRSDAGSAFA